MQPTYNDPMTNDIMPNASQRHSDEIQDIITKAPSWLLRWGISLFFGILLLMLVLSAMIRYPDIVNAPLKIDSLNPAEPMASKIPGKIEQLLVTPYEIVKTGQPLAYISSKEKTSGKYIINASQSGRVSFAGVIYEGMAFDAKQVLFYIIPEKQQFFGEMSLTQNNMGKIKKGQQVLVKLKSYPFEEYGMIRGHIKYIAEVPYKDSIFISKVDFKIQNSSDLKRPIRLKQGMMADAEIITQDATILQRVSRSFLKMINK